MQKISLRPAVHEDSSFLYEMMQDKEYQKYYLSRLLLKSVEEAKESILRTKKEAKKGKEHYFIATLDGKSIGILHIYKISKKDHKGSIGYGLMKEHWGKGFGTQIAALGIEFMKNTLKLHSCEATVDPANEATCKVLEKNGFQRIGLAKDYYFDKGKFIDRVLYWKIL